MTSSYLNLRAFEIASQVESRAAELRVTAFTADNGTRILDFGVAAKGSLEAGVLLAEICLGGKGQVTLVPGTHIPGPAVCITTDQPVAACMASQYAGWQISHEKFFAMGSGPMRAAGSKEALFEQIGNREQPTKIVGVLETGKLPSADVCAKIADTCGVTGSRLTLCVARTASIAGTVQVVARSVETAIHKMHEVGFDLTNLVSGFGTAPLPPVANNDLVGIGRTNDAVLYGGEVTLWLTDDDATVAALGPKLPSSSSSDYGEPFSTIFERYGHDFYKVDPLLFSPASITLVNLNSGTMFQFGKTDSRVLRRSFMGLSSD